MPDPDFYLHAAACIPRTPREIAEHDTMGESLLAMLHQANATVPRPDGLHCVYGKCQGPPKGPNYMCNPGCSFTMTAVDPLAALLRDFEEQRESAEPPLTYQEALACYVHASGDPRVYEAMFAEIRRLEAENEELRRQLRSPGGFHA